MIRVTVRVQVEGGQPFNAEVEINAEKLDPANMPPRLSGAFKKLPSKTEDDTVRANFLLHTSRNSDSSSHTIWFHGNRIGYRFTMSSDTSPDFTAEKV